MEVTSCPGSAALHLLQARQSGAISMDRESCKRNPRPDDRRQRRHLIVAHKSTYFKTHPHFTSTRSSQNDSLKFLTATLINCFPRRAHILNPHFAASVFRSGYSSVSRAIREHFPSRISADPPTFFYHLVRVALIVVNALLRMASIGN